VYYSFAVSFIGFTIAMKTALVWMPPASIFFPSPQIGYLKAFASKQGIHVDDHYFNLSFAELVGTIRYQYLLERDNSRLFECLFSMVLFENKTFMQDYLNRSCCDQSILQELLEIRITDWLNMVVERLLSRQYGFIGFSCAFNQVLPSLAVAKKIKKEQPQVLVAFGGAELFPSFAKEIIKKCFFIDHIVLGKGENVLCDIVNHIRTEKLVDVPDNERSLDNLVTPDYGTYFNECRKKHVEKKHGFQNTGRIIPILGSRGCWWAEKSRCSFCSGCGEVNQTYLQRKATDVIGEMKKLSKKYKSKYFNFIDAVEPIDFYSSEGLLNKLAQSKNQYTIFHQLRVPRNQNSFKMLQDAQVRIIQPGLESLDSNILRLMKKGIKAKDVLRCLYWSRVYGLEVSWNILIGHPGERPEWINNISRIIPKIHHLQPPAKLTNVLIKRKSPLFETILASHYTASPSRLIPDTRLGYLYPQDWNHREISFTFENPQTITRELEKAHEELNLLVSHWIHLWQSDSRPQLSVTKTNDDWQIVDTRSHSREYHLKGKELEVAKQICSDRDKNIKYESYSKYQTATGKLIEKEIVIVLDDCLIWLPTFSDETKGNP